MKALKIRERERVQASPPPGHRQSWTEWQVVQGRKVISRHDFKEQAERFVRAAEADRKGQPE